MSTRIEVRRNSDGTPDEVLLYVDEKCVAHVEQMDEDHWWAEFGDGDEWVHMNWTSKSKITLLVEENP